MIEKQTAMYCELLRSTEKDGIYDLIEYLEKNGFFEQPASTQYHLSRPSGLLEHSLNVYGLMMEHYTETAKLEMSENDIILTALLHDIGKMGWNNQPGYLANVLKGGKLSDAKPYVRNADLIQMQHQDLSLLIACKFIDLTDAQIVAIKYHNGLYTPDGRDINGKETPLMLLLHFCDMWASRVTEVTE